VKIEVGDKTSINEELDLKTAEPELYLDKLTQK
jgi:hypothetical protein